MGNPHPSGSYALSSHLTPLDFDAQTCQNRSYKLNSQSKYNHTSRRGIPTIRRRSVAAISMTVSVSVASSLPSSLQNQDRRPKSRSLANHSDNFERPAAISQPSLLRHSCISFCAKRIVPKIRPGSHSPVLARLSALVAPLLHPQDLSMQVTRPTPRRDAIPFDALSSTGTRGLRTFAEPLPWQPRPKLLMHSWLPRKTPLHRSLSPPHSGSWMKL